LEILSDPDLRGVFDEKELMLIEIEEDLPLFTISEVEFSRTHLLTITLNHK